MAHAADTNTKARRGFRKRAVLFVAGGFVVLGALVALVALNGSHSLVPDKVRVAVPFSVYYPGNIPNGYNLNMKSFRLADSGVVVFSIKRRDGQNIIFSEQQQPSSSDMNNFISGYIPLNSLVQVPLGQAKIGAYGTAPNIRTVASLPITSGPWLIVTAPSDMNHDTLVILLQSLTK